MSEALNVTKAAFGGLREVTTAPLWQYDYGQILQITGLDLPQAFEVHFSNSRKSGETITQIGTDRQVVIPDMYLTSGADIYAFIFLHDGLTDGETEYVIKIPVRERPEPSDIEPTPEQQDAITEAIAALNDAVDKADVAITHYPQIIDGVWHVWDVTNGVYVSTGVEAQGNGIASAVLNPDYTLTLTFTDGTTYTTPSIRGAQGEQGEGGLSILLTRQAIVLPTDNNRIPQSALTASVEVTAVKGTEIVGLDDVSGSSVNMEYIDGQGRRHGTFVMPTIEVTYDDIRDINVKYKLTYEFKTSPYYFMADSGNITLTIEIDGVTYKRTIPWTLSKQGEAGADAVNVFLRDPVTLIPTGSDGYHANQQIVSTYVYAFKDGEPCTITSVTATPVTVQHDPLHLEGIDAVVTVSGTSALVKYTLPAGTGLRNDRQIPTITAVVDGETHTATMCIVSARQGDVGTTPDLTIGTVQTLPAGSQATASITGTDEEPVLNLGLPKGDAGDDYVLTEQDKEEIADIVLESDGLQSELNDKADIIISNAEGAIATFEDGGDDMPMVSCVANIEPVQSGSGDPSPDNIRPISGWTGLNLVVSPTEDAQDGTTYPISWASEAGTVYGGTVDLVSGVLAVRAVYTSLEGASVYRDNGTYIIYRKSQLSVAANVYGGEFAKCNITSSFGNVSSATLETKIQFPTAITTSIFASIPASVQVGNVECCYEIATPRTYQLTPTEVKTFLGLNNVWADTGDTTVEYRADTRLYIEKLTQPEEYDMIADSAITSGKFFMIGNTLYRALANIASGATITVGTNATKMSLSDALNALA